MLESTEELQRERRAEHKRMLLECTYKTGPNEYYYCGPDSVRYERFSKNGLRENLEALGFPNTSTERPFGMTKMND